MVLNDDLNREFGQYTLLEKLGVGGMATVYRAIHKKHEKEVAVKILHEHFADDEIATKRLEREAKITAQLKHPNIVPILAFNVAEGRPYLVMPFYPGGTLADYFHKPREMPHDVTLKVLEELAKGLDYAHSKGVIHRDFKLENILLGKNNRPSISDFGIARLVDTTKLTATGHFVGTPHYMAPEQASADPDSVDHRADLYAFSVMAYLMLTGVFPFTATDAFQLVIKHNTQPPPTPGLINDQLSANVDAVLLRGLAKRPIERYQTASDFVKGLQRAMSDLSPMTTIIDLALPNPLGSNAGASFEALRESNRVDENATRDFMPDDQVDEGIPAIVPDVTPEKERNYRIPAIIGTFSLLACGMVAFLMYMTGSFDFINNSALIDAEAAELTEEVTEMVESTEEAESTEVVGGNEEAESTDSVEASVADETDTASDDNEAATDEISSTDTNTVTAVPSVRASSTVRASATTIPATNTQRPTSTTRPTNTRIPATNTQRPTNTSIPPTPIPPTPTPVPPTPVPPTPIPPTPVPPTPIPPPPPTQPPSVIDPIVNPVSTVVDPILPGGDDDDNGVCVPLVNC